MSGMFVFVCLFSLTDRNKQVRCEIFRFSFSCIRDHTNGFPKIVHTDILPSQNLTFTFLNIQVWGVLFWIYCEH